MHKSGCKSTNRAPKLELRTTKKRISLVANVSQRRGDKRILTYETSENFIYPPLRVWKRLYNTLQVAKRGPVRVLSSHNDEMIRLPPKELNGKTHAKCQKSTPPRE